MTTTRSIWLRAALLYLLLLNGSVGMWATFAPRSFYEDFPGGGYLFGPDGATLAATADWSEGVLDVDVPLGE